MSQYRAPHSAHVAARPDRTYALCQYRAWRIGGVGDSGSVPGSASTGPAVALVACKRIRSLSTAQI
eukprot:2047521-Rhodomonas_salina.7